MKIAMIGQKGMPTLWGGIERHVEELSVRLAKQGHAVFAFARRWYSKSPRKHKGVNIVFAPTIHTKHLDAIIHSITSTAKAIRMGEWAACKFAHQTITVSDTLRQYCDEAYDTECAYIPNGVNVSAVKNFGKLKKFGLKANGYIGFFSRLVPHKNAHLLIAAWKNIAKKNPALVKNLKLAIVGDSSFTDKYVSELREMVRGEKSIIMTGYQSGEALCQLFAGARIIAHPSESEGMSIAILEAMSYGKTVLASDIPENKETLGSCGFYSRRNSLDDLEKKLTYLLKNPRILKSMGERAQNRVRNNFDWEKIVKQVGNIYKTDIKAELVTAEV